MKKLLVSLALVIAAAALGASFLSRHKTMPRVTFSAKDFPEHGISLIVPSDPAFAGMKAQLTKSKSGSTDESYSVFLKNTGSRAVVGYSIKWECVNAGGVASEVHTSNVVSWIFLHGDESSRRAALGRAREVIKPDSIWFIPLSLPAQPLDGNPDGMTFDEEEDRVEGCQSVTVVVDGVFFDDGTFIGPDATNFFTEVQTQMNARYAILREIQNDLKAGKKADEIFRGLEAIRDQQNVNLGEPPSANEFHAYFRKIFAADVLGMKEVGGAEKAMEDVHQQLNQPWVNLRKL